MRAIRVTKQFDRTNQLGQYSLHLLEKDNTGRNVLRMYVGAEGWSLGAMSDGKTTWHRGMFCHNSTCFSR